MIIVYAFIAFAVPGVFAGSPDGGVTEEGMKMGANHQVSRGARGVSTSTSPSPAGRNGQVCRETRNGFWILIAWI